MDDLDLDAAPPLSTLTIAFAAMFYVAAAILVLGLLIQTVRLVRSAVRAGGIDLPETPAEAGHAGRAVRLAGEVFLLRSTFFADRWAWIFGAAFHFGLFLVLVRHLRYMLEPGWIGPLWKLLLIVQPFGVYGGFALPLGAGARWVRQVWLGDRRVLTSRIDHAVLALLVAIPLLGYVNTYVRTDIVAVKAFMVGLLTFAWKPLPSDPVLLAHLWLAAALMMLLPFSRLLLLIPFGRMLHVPGFLDPQARSRLRPTTGWAAAVILLALLGPPALVAAAQVAKDGIRPAPRFAGLVAAHRSDDSTVMIRFHPNFLMAHRTTVVHAGVRTPNDNIERCVACHAVNGAAGTPVGYDDPQHFCGSCHNRVAVSIDCFECHNSRLSKQESALPSSTRFAALAPRAATPLPPSPERSAAP
jgi:nitrate reductase gamma subunit